MTITTNLTDNKYTISPVGRVDTNTAPALQDAVAALPEGADTLILDFDGVEYISSAGLRVLLSSQKHMNDIGEMSLINVRPEVKEVLDITGFSDILIIR